MFYAIRCKHCKNWFVQEITKPLRDAVVRCRRDGCKSYNLKSVKEAFLKSEISIAFRYADDAREWLRQKQFIEHTTQEVVFQTYKLK